MFYKIDLNIKTDDLNTASHDLERIFKHPKYEAFNDLEKKEWNSLQTLIEAGKIKSKKSKS